MQNSKTIEEYISIYPEDVQEILRKFRKIIHDVAPTATEAISYGIPTFKLNGKNLVHFGGFKDHVSFFPTGGGVEKFKKELSKFDVSKGTIRFPFDQKIPWDLITKITKFRVEETTSKTKV